MVDKLPDISGRSGPQEAQPVVQLGPDGSVFDPARRNRSLGYQQIVLTTDDPAEPQVPEGAMMALIRPEGGGIRYVDSAGDPDPTTTFGMPVEDGETLIYDATMDGVRVIARTEGVTLNLIFYGAPPDAD